MPSSATGVFQPETQQPLHPVQHQMPLRQPQALVLSLLLSLG
ncbi:hypothetical protein P4S72_03880 [Vibrio sp. PP-XX7]